MNDVIAYFIMLAIIAIAFQSCNIAGDLHNGDGSGESNALSHG
jgi:hypothetical protein